MTQAKPYNISKHLVWEAYKRVKANRGAAGVDGQSLAMFEKDLKNNLYKIWNRMSSGSYMPPAVRLVEIPKGNTGATRPLAYRRSPIGSPSRVVSSSPGPAAIFSFGASTLKRLTNQPVCVRTRPLPWSVSILQRPTPNDSGASLTLTPTVPSASFF